MKKSDLIKSLAKKSAVPELSASLFFEIFIKKVYELLKSGEAIKVRDLGYFFLKKGKIQNSDSPGNETEIIDLLVFTENTDKVDQKDYLFFSIPGEDEENFSSVDSCFSLSIGKPVIPLTGSKSFEYFVPPAEWELRRLYDTRIDNFLEEIEIILNETRQDEVISVDQNDIEMYDPPEIQSIKSVDMKQEERDNIPAASEEEGRKEGESTGPDAKEFDEGLKKEIEKLSFESGEEKIDDWKITEPYVDKLPPELIENNDDENIFSSTSDISPEDTTSQPNENEKPLDEEFKIVEPLSKSVSDDWNFEEIDWELMNEDFNRSELDDIDIYETVDEKGFTELHLKTSGNLDAEKNETPVIPGKTGRDIKNTSDEKVIIENRTKAGRKIILTVLLIVILGAAAFYYYLNSGKEMPVQSENIEMAGSPPAIINRDYDVPVTLNESGNKEADEYDAFEKDALNSEEIPAENISENESNLPASQEISGNVPGTNERPVRVKGYIYRAGENFIVQVSSWKYKKNAEEHVESLKSRGLNSYIEPGGSLYRVRVSGFKSLEDAEDFFRKNK